MGRVTAIVLAYDRPDYLQQALDSVAAQTRVPDEVLVVDDASPGGPLAEHVDGRGLPARFLRLERNSGPAAAAATAVRASSGDFVTFLNDDDLWHPGFVEALSDALAADSSAGIAFCDHGVVHPDGAMDDVFADELSAQYRRDGLGAGSVGTLQEFAALALVDQTVAASSFGVSRREALNPEIILAGGDVWDYFVPLSVALCGYSGTYVPERLGWYRISPEGVTASWTRPERRISATARRLAADVLVLCDPALRNLHGRARITAARRVASGFRTALISGNPRMLVHWADQSVQAIVRPGRAAARGR